MNTIGNKIPTAWFSSGKKQEGKVITRQVFIAVQFKQQQPFLASTIN